MSCKTEKPDTNTTTSDILSITVQPVFGSELLFLDSSYQTPEGYDIQFTEIKFYMQDIRSDSISFKDAALFDYRSRGINLIEVSGDKDDYENIQANLGVDSIVNHNDPVGFNPSSWLYISNSNDMHWDWNPGYLFVKIEAKVDTIQDGNPLFNHNVIFHVGRDENLKMLSFNDINWNIASVGIGEVSSGYVLPLKLDLLYFLDTGISSIDVKTEFISHTGPGEELISAKVMDNFKEALIPF